MNKVSTNLATAPAVDTVTPRKLTFTKIRSLFDATFVNVLTIALLVIFLAPFLFMVFTSMKNQSQITTVGSPIYPAEFPTFEYNGKPLEIFRVPLPDGSTKELALLKKGQKESVFVDPQNPDAGEIVWQGSWRARSNGVRTSSHTPPLNS